MTEKLIVLSDLHLWGPEDPLYRALLRFLEFKLESGDKFFIVGDLFDLFIGDKNIFRKRYHELIQHLRDLHHRNIEVFYLEGNHDFQLENLFDDCGHVRLYADALDYEWDHRKFHFRHGDKINPKDRGYQVFHFLTRNLVSQCIIEAVPGAWIDRIGQVMAKKSRQYHMDPSEEVIQFFRNYACEQISNHGYDFVIMGHSHFMDDIRFRMENHKGQYVNVGFPRKHRKYLELLPGQEFFELKSWTDFVTPLKPVHIVNE